MNLPKISDMDDQLNSGLDAQVRLINWFLFHLCFTTIDYVEVVTRSILETFPNCFSLKPAR